MEKNQRTVSFLGSFFEWEPKTPCVFVFIKKNKKFELFGLWTSKTQQKQTPFEESKNSPKENKNNNTTWTSNQKSSVYVCFCCVF